MSRSSYASMSGEIETQKISTSQKLWPSSLCPPPANSVRMASCTVCCCRKVLTSCLMATWITASGCPSIKGMRLYSSERCHEVGCKARERVKSGETPILGVCVWMCSALSCVRIELCLQR
eukprot:5364990-Prymnesium_polylepis.1